MLSRRLLPLYAAAFLQAFALWVPIEKLFMTTIGFNSATVGVMAAVYAVVVPILEVPSGVLADRWSRRGVLVLASVAAIVSVIVGGLSNSVALYMLAAVFLGVFFALQSGTFESIVYDTVLEETGSSDAFEQSIGRVRVIESVALVTSALAGAVIAEAVSLPAAYFLTAPLLVLSAAAILLFREPRLHKAEEEQPLRDQITATFRAILSGGYLRLVVAITIVGSLLMQGTLEFGPLWLVALSVPAVFFGPQWAGITSALGIGGILGSRAWLTGRVVVWLLAAGLITCCVVLAVSTDPLLVVAVQVVVVLIVVAVSIPVTRSLHDNIPSTIRAGVASGVSTLTWLAFVPFALVVGAVAQSGGINQAGWLFTLIAAACAALMIVVLPRARSSVESAAAVTSTATMELASFAEDRFLPPDDPAWPGHWANPPQNWTALGIALDGPEVLSEVRAALTSLPEQLRRVIILRDLEGRSPEEVSRELEMSSEEMAVTLHQARGLVRDRLERYLAAGGTG